jgi:hypothetical protein
MSTDQAMNSSAESPMQAAADTLQTAANAARDGAADASAKVRELLPKVSATVSRGVYNGSYYVAFGVVFPTLFLCRVIPGGQALAAGIVDGAAAASDNIREMRGKKETEACSTACCASTPPA